MNQGLLGLPMPQSAVAPYINIQDQKTQNSNGGAFTSGSFLTRTLNTIVNNDQSLASLASNQITLPAGTYRCRILVPGFKVNQHQAQLQNVTTGAIILLGSGSCSDSATSSQTNSEITGKFTLSVSTVLLVQHKCALTNGTNGFGVAGNLTTEVFTVVEIWKEA